MNRLSLIFRQRFRRRRMTREEQIANTNEEVLRLKEMGLDIREIALKTAIKKSYIVKVLRESKNKAQRKSKICFNI